VIPGWLLELPGRDEAREAAREELSRRAYQEARPPLLERFVLWLLDRIGQLFDRASGAVPGGGWGLVALVLLVTLLAAVVLTRLRPSRRARGAAVFVPGQVRSAAEHRAAADAAAAQGDFALAVTERFRAVVRELETRGVVEPRPGWTADEVARYGGAAVPVVAEPLARAATLFDEVRYGGRPATATTYGSVVALDAQVTQARLVVTT
jgi:hypothetical protein